MVFNKQGFQVPLWSQQWKLDKLEGPHCYNTPSCPLIISCVQHQHSFSWGWIAVPSMKRILPVEGKLWCRRDFIVPFFLEKSWADDLEDISQGQKSLYMTHLLLVEDTSTNHGKDPSSGRKVMEWIWFHLQMAGERYCTFDISIGEAGCNAFCSDILVSLLHTVVFLDRWFLSFPVACLPK